MRFKLNKGNIAAELDTSRFDSNFKEAQKRLNVLIVADTTPYIPFQQGQLRSQVRYPQGLSGNEIEWYAPYAHYQYYGEVLTDENGSTYVGKGEVKTVHTGRPLTYREPNTGAFWFETAKKNHKREWIAEVKRISGKG